MPNNAKAAFGTNANQVLEAMLSEFQPPPFGMVKQELINMSKGSTKIPSYKMITRIQQCHEDKKELAQFAIRECCAHFTPEELDALKNIN